MTVFCSVLYAPLRGDTVKNNSGLLEVVAPKGANNLPVNGMTGTGYMHQHRNAAQYMGQLRPEEVIK